jgi:hypothetical protein
MNRKAQERAQEYERSMKASLANDPEYMQYARGVEIPTGVAAVLLGEHVNSASFRRLMAGIPRRKAGKRQMVWIGDLAAAVVKRQEATR